MEILGFRNNSITLNNEEHNSYAPGLHHLCLWVENKNAIEEIANMTKNKGIKITVSKLYNECTSDNYAIFLKDPDGVELEITNNR